MVPSDLRLLGEEHVIFIIRWVVIVDECVGSHVVVVAVNIVEKAGAEKFVQCGTHSLLQSIEGFFYLMAIFWAAGALNKVVVVFKFTSAGAALGFFITAIAMHPAAGWEFSHTMLVCPCLTLLTMFAVYRGE